MPDSSATNNQLNFRMSRITRMLRAENCRKSRYRRLRRNAIASYNGAASVKSKKSVIQKKKSVSGICGRTISSCRWWLPHIAQMNTTHGNTGSHYSPAIPYRFYSISNPISRTSCLTTFTLTVEASSLSYRRRKTT